MEAYKSVAPDSGTEGCNARHFFTRLLNSVSGRDEYSGVTHIADSQLHVSTIDLSATGPQASSTFLGRKAYYKFHYTKYLYADSANDFVLRMLDQIKDPYYEQGSESDSSKSSLLGYTSFDSTVYSDDESSPSATSKSSEHRRLQEIRDCCDNGYYLSDFKNLTEEEEFGPVLLDDEATALMQDGLDDDDLDQLEPLYSTHCDERQKEEMLFQNTEVSGGQSWEHSADD